MGLFSTAHKNSYSACSRIALMIRKEHNFFLPIQVFGHVVRQTQLLRTSELRMLLKLSQNSMFNKLACTPDNIKHFLQNTCVCG